MAQSFTVGYGHGEHLWKSQGGGSRAATAVANTSPAAAEKELFWVPKDQKRCLHQGWMASVGTRLAFVGLWAE